MNTLRSLILFLAIFYSLVSFGQLSGSFKNYDHAKNRDIEVKLYYQSYISHHQEEVNIRPDSLGKFEITLPEKMSNQVLYLNIPKYYSGTIIINKGLHISLNAKKKKNLVGMVHSKGLLSGPDADMVYYWNKSYTTSLSKFSKKRVDLVFYSKDSAHLRLQKRIQLHQEYLVEIEEFISKRKSTYGGIIKDDFIAKYYYDLLVLGFSTPLEDRLIQEIANTSFIHSSMYTMEMNSFLFYQLFYGKSLDNRSQIEHTVKPYIPEQEQSNFSLFLDEYVKKINRESYDKHIYDLGIIDYLTKYENEIFKYRISALNDKLLSYKITPNNHLLMAGIPKQIWERELYFNEFEHLITEGWAKAIISKIKADDEHLTKELLAMHITDQSNTLGSPVGHNATTNMYNCMQDSLSELLDAIKNEYKGKTIIVDLWGTWCGPCIRDIKTSKERKVELQKSNVEIVYLCEGKGSKIGFWKEKVVQLKMTGNQLFLSPSLTNQFLEKFEITGYPSHVIIDKNGKYHLDEEHFISRIDIEEFLKVYAP
ncbi:MAG: hypothetical protein COA58_05415 [Bacteroidetes bacterium]|nr:MAG: hypothetical protein COA58_05415 [Bacteroidota bacterium]